MHDLPDGYLLRHPTPDDLHTVLAVINANDKLMMGEEDTSPSDLRQHWQTIDITTNAWVLCNAQNAIVAYEELHPMQHGRFGLDGYVHPDHMGFGLGSYLVNIAEARSHELIGTYPPEYELFLTAGNVAGDENANAMFAALGYEATRSYYRMVLDVDGVPAPAQIPDGYAIQPFTLDDAKSAYDLHMTSFVGHYGFARRSFDVWYADKIKHNERFRAQDWAIIVYGNTPVAFGFNYLREDGMGWVQTLGVHPDHRQRGLGRAVLQHSFVLLHLAGAQRIGLGVDSQNRSGAVKLYQDAGMYIDQHFLHQEKIMRTGQRQSDN